MALLAATIACLAGTIGAGYLARLRIVDKDSWVAHTEEVKLAIAACDLALARGDIARMRGAEATVQGLTVDNPVQQRNVARAIELTVRAELPHEELGALLDAMTLEENRLMTMRLDEMAAARRHSANIFTIGAVLTVLFGALSWAMQGAQSRALTSARDATSRDKGLLEAVLESVDEGILAVDVSRKTIAINRAARVMVGASFPLGRLPEDWRPALTASYEDGSTMAPSRALSAASLRRTSST